MAEIEFAATENACGQTLLALVSGGSAIIAELLRLSDPDVIPAVFLGTDPREKEKYGRLLFDLRYVENSEGYDAQIDANPELVDLDEEFRETHTPFLQRMFKLFKSIHQFYTDFMAFLEELQDGVFVEYTLENVFLDVEGRQLMCEALYLYGVMLLLMDSRISGLAREQLIVAHLRYKGLASVDNVEAIMTLCRGTGFDPKSGQRPANYPEGLFGRLPLPWDFVKNTIGCLTTVDIYNRHSAYPSRDHRAAALASQSAMLYVILFFAPKILKEESAQMREIVDKHFYDNWVIAYYLGFTVDLAHAWEPYKAARIALKNILPKANVQRITDEYAAKLKAMNEALSTFLDEGVLTMDFVLDNVRKLMQTVRNSNVALRWYFLHRTTANRRFREIVYNSATTSELLKLCMNTAQFEFILKQLFQQLLETREQRWMESQTEAKDRMLELSEYFSGQRALTRAPKNEKLQEGGSDVTWFKEMSDEIASIELNKFTLAGRKIAMLDQALEDVQTFHQIDTSLQVKTFLLETREYLKSMIRLVNMRGKVLGDLDIISDFSFAWITIKDYTTLLQQRVKQSPKIVLLLRAVFLKLSSVMEIPLERITQYESPDDVSVAEYFSSELVKYVRTVLDVIPKGVFELLAQIIARIGRLKSIPKKLERSDLKMYAQLEERHEIAKLTHQVSVFADGILAMKTTLYGVIKLDPKRLLEDGIRRELVRQMTSALQETLVFKTGRVEDFEAAITALAKRLRDFRVSFEYIQDYLNIYGLKVWQEEFTRIVNYHVEQESNSFLKKKLKQNSQNISKNFMGRLTRELLQETDSRKTVYIEALQAWYDLPIRHEVVGIRTFDLLCRGLSVVGLMGVDRLISFMLVKNLQNFLRLYNARLGQFRPVISTLLQALHPTRHFPQHDVPNQAARIYSVALQRTATLWPGFIDFVCRVGQIQLLRRQISNELNFACKMDSKTLACALETMNDALVKDVRSHYEDPATFPYPGNPILPEVEQFLLASGLNEPLHRIYATSKPLEGIPLFVFLFVISQCRKFDWNKRLSTLVHLKSGDPLDGAPFVVGIITLLRQFHSSYLQDFLAYMGQFVRATIHSSAGVHDSLQQFPPENVNVLHFLDLFARFAQLPRSTLEAHIPSYVLETAALVS